MRFNSGWIKIHRGVVDGDIGSRGTLLAVWVLLLCWATRFESKILWQGKQRVIPPGSVLCGLAELAEKLQFSKSTIRRALQHLEMRGSVRIDSGTRGTLITICNWSKYQDLPDICETQTEHGRHTEETRTAHGRTLIGELKNLRIKEREREIDKKISIEGMKDCLDAWKITLSKYKIRKDARLDELQIARLIQIHGVQKTRLALLGAGFEEKSRDYDPAKHVNIHRLSTAKLFETFVNLGARHDAPAREVHAVEVSP